MDWTGIQKLLAINGAAGDHFGYSVLLLGDTVIIGTKGDDNGDNSGSEYILEKKKKGCFFDIMTR
ncbi:MAG TPA: FG-GAP repeat protein [Candidatus Thermoplasmatota archaeon]|nr:FG-GAP repeat protein [Candidatus Thermoplasmatota archaeon]